MDCCAEWVPEPRFHVVATFPVQSPTKKNTHTPHPMPPQSSLLDVLIKYMIFLFSSERFAGKQTLLY